MPEPTRANRGEYIRRLAWQWGLPTGLGLAAFAVWEAGVQRGAWLQAFRGATFSVLIGVFLAGPAFGYTMWRFDHWMQRRDD